MDNQPGSAFFNAPLLPPLTRHLSSSLPSGGPPLTAWIAENPAKRQRLSPGADDQYSSRHHQRLVQQTPQDGRESGPGSKPWTWNTQTSYPDGWAATNADPLRKDAEAAISSGVPVSAPVSGTAAASAAYVRRKRSVAACQFCRLRKTKCDNVRPVCGTCRRHQAKCVYADGSEGDALQLGLDEASSRHREVLERLDDIRDLLASSSSLPADVRSSGTSELAPLDAGNRDESCRAGVGTPREAQGALTRQPQSVSPKSSSVYLQHTKCESILKWPVLHAVMTPDDAAIDSFLFDAHVSGDIAEDEGAPTSPLTSKKQPKTRQTAIQEVEDQNGGDQAFVSLCEKFLALVNCRNPIMDAHDLLSYAESVTNRGLDWDAKSCLVLLACALASYSRAWRPPSSSQTPSSTPTLKAATRRNSTVPPKVMSESDDEAAEAYYEAAQRRLGSLGSSLIDIQCFYFASLFEKFAFRPVKAWMHLQQAATRLRLHHMVQVRSECRLQPDYEEVDSGPSTISHHFEQRAFWSIHKAEREFATELGMTLASDLSSFEYPAAFPTPPETLNRLISSDDEDCDMSDVFSPRRNEFIWFFYLAQISLRRTLDEVLSVMYEKGEQNWVENIDLICRQHEESKKQIADWQSHLPPTMRYDPASQPNNEMGYYLEGRFEEWNEFILRPLVYYCLHYPPAEPPTPTITALAQRYMALCNDCIVRCSTYDRHGGTWFVLRRTFRCTLVVLAAVVADGPLRPPENWQDLSRLTLATLARWSSGVRDLQRMHMVLERVFHAVCDALEASIGSS